MKLNELLSKFGDVEITEEMEKELKNKLGIKDDKAWKPKVGDRYWFIGEYGVYKAVWNDDKFDKFRYSIGNCFKTKEEAEFAVEKLIVIAQLQQFAEEHNENKIDWKNYEQDKWIMSYKRDSGRIIIESWRHLQRTTIIFTSKEIAQQAIKIIGEDRLKKYYFEVEE